MKDHLATALSRIASGSAVVGQWTARHAHNLAFTFGFMAIAVGFAMYDISLGLIIPGSIVCGLLAWGRVSAGPPNRGNDNA